MEAWEDVCGVCLEKSSPNCFALREPLNIINTTPNPRIRRTPAHVIFSFGSRLDSSSQESLSQNTVILHIKHSMSHAPSLLFPSHLSTTSISTCTLIRPSTRRLLTSSSHGDTETRTTTITRGVEKLQGRTGAGSKQKWVQCSLLKKRPKMHHKCDVSFMAVSAHRKCDCGERSWNFVLTKMRYKSATFRFVVEKGQHFLKSVFDIPRGGRQ